MDRLGTVFHTATTTTLVDNYTKKKKPHCLLLASGEKVRERRDVGVVYKIVEVVVLVYFLILGKRKVDNFFTCGGTVPAYDEDSATISVSSWRRKRKLTDRSVRLRPEGSHWRSQTDHGLRSIIIITTTTNTTNLFAQE